MGIMNKFEQASGRNREGEDTPENKVISLEKFFADRYQGEDFENLPDIIKESYEEEEIKEGMKKYEEAQEANKKPETKDKLLFSDEEMKEMVH